MRLALWLNSLALMGTVAFGQAPPPGRPGPPTVRAQGEATVSVRPDQVRIDIGVVTQAQTAESAAAQNAKQTSEVIEALKKALGAGADVKTSGYSIHPNYKHSREGGAPTITGYTASNTVQIQSSDVGGVGKVIDAATRVGANNVHGIHFTLKNEQSVRAEALKEAARNARANAEAMAAGFGMKIGRILQIADGEPVQVIPVRREMMMRAQADTAAASTPIEPGNVQVRAVVTLTVELLP